MVVPAYSRLLVKSRRASPATLCDFCGVGQRRQKNGMACGRSCAR